MDEMRNRESKSSRSILEYLAFSVLSWVIFGIGLLSPLTPSEGYPSWVTLFFFIGMPALLIVASMIWARRWILKFAGIVQLIFLGLLVRWLLIEVLHHPYVSGLW